MVLEQYLVSTDDGWIFRKVQYCRGALQPEDESKGGREMLRGSLLAAYSAILDSLMADANRQMGIIHRLLARSVNSGLAGLNPGIAWGVLTVVRPDGDSQRFSRGGIYALPATLEDLPPVAGIIMADKGKMLSHVQL
jgi:hypothetical protein